MTNVLLELLEDLQNILTTCPDVHWRSRLERAVKRAGGIRTYYSVTETARFEERERIEAELLSGRVVCNGVTYYVVPAVRTDPETLTAETGEAVRKLVDGANDPARGLDRAQEYLDRIDALLSDPDPKDNK